MTGTGRRLLKAISPADFGLPDFTERPPRRWWSFVLVVRLFTLSFVLVVRLFTLFFVLVVRLFILFSF